MYDPTVGRFTTQDPSEFVGGDENLYRYVKNSPTNAIDPTGLASLTLNPEDPTNMPWQDTSRGWVDFYTEPYFKITCSCDPVSAIVTKRCGLFRRRCTSITMFQAHCKVEAGWTIVINSDAAKRVIDGGDEQSMEGGPAPTTLNGLLAGIYGHEQRHILSQINFLRSLQQKLTAREGQLLSDGCQCGEYAESLKEWATNEFKRFSDDEYSHRNPMSPHDQILYPPLGGQFPNGTPELKGGPAPDEDPFKKRQFPF